MKKRRSNPSRRGLLKIGIAGWEGQRLRRRKVGSHIARRRCFDRPHVSRMGLTRGPGRTTLQELTLRRCAPGGHIVTTSLPRGTLSLPAVLFSIGGRTHHAGQAGGANPMRDIPRFVAVLDAGQYNAKALATTVVSIERMLEAYEEVAYRTTVTAIMTS